MVRKISKEGLSLIKNFEGCRLAAYKPVPTEQYWTIGWGHYGPVLSLSLSLLKLRLTRCWSRIWLSMKPMSITQHMYQ